MGDADGRILEGAAEPLLALPEAFLGSFEVGDIHDAAEEADRPADGVANGHAA